MCSPIFRQTGQSPKKCLPSLLLPSPSRFPSLLLPSPSRCSDPSLPCTTKPPAVRLLRQSATQSSIFYQNKREKLSKDNIEAERGQEDYEEGQNNLGQQTTCTRTRTRRASGRTSLEHFGHGRAGALAHRNSRLNNRTEFKTGQGSSSKEHQEGQFWDILDWTVNSCSDAPPTFPLPRLLKCQQ